MKPTYLVIILAGLFSAGCDSKSEKMLRNIKLPDGAEVRYLEKPGYLGDDGYDVTLGRFPIGTKYWEFHGTISGLPDNGPVDIYFRIHRKQQNYFLMESTSLYLSIETGEDTYSFSPRYDELVARTGWGDYLHITTDSWAESITVMSKQEMSITVRYIYEGDDSGAIPTEDAELHITSGGFK